MKRQYNAGKSCVKLMIALGLAAGLTGCIGAPVVPPLGLIYTNIDAPLSLAGEVGSRRGESTVISIAGLISTGDGSVKAAAAAGGITRVQRVDYEFFNLIGIYQRYKTVAYGD